MPKIKTRKSLSKRIAKKTSTKKILRRKTLSQHLAHRKSKRTRKSSGNKIEVTKSNIKKMRAFAPYK